MMGHHTGSTKTFQSSCSGERRGYPGARLGPQSHKGTSLLREQTAWEPRGPRREPGRAVPPASPWRRSWTEQLEGHVPASPQEAPRCLTIPRDRRKRSKLPPGDVSKAATWVHLQSCHLGTSPEQLHFGPCDAPLTAGRCRRHRAHRRLSGSRASSLQEQLCAGCWQAAQRWQSHKRKAEGGRRKAEEATGQKRDHLKHGVRGESTDTLDRGETNQRVPEQ